MPLPQGQALLLRFVVREHGRQPLVESPRNPFIHLALGPPVHLKQIRSAAWAFLRHPCGAQLQFEGVSVGLAGPSRHTVAADHGSAAAQNWEQHPTDSFVPARDVLGLGARDLQCTGEEPLVLPTGHRRLVMAGKLRQCRDRAFGQMLSLQEQRQSLLA
eukprot:2744226-Rhodomonas_salina.2